MNPDTVGRHLGYVALGFVCLLAVSIITTLVILIAANFPMALLIACVLVASWGIGLFIRDEQESNRRHAARMTSTIRIPPPPAEE